MSETADIARRAVEGGFADPVFDAQAVFAQLLQAMSRPGTIVDFGKRCTPPAPLSPAQGAILGALADADTPVFVEGGNDALVAWLGFQTGARLAEPQEARFAVVGRFDAAALNMLPPVLVRSPRFAEIRFIMSPPPPRLLLYLLLLLLELLFLPLLLVFLEVRLLFVLLFLNTNLLLLHLTHCRLCNLSTLYPCLCDFHPAIQKAKFHLRVLLLL